MSAPGALVQKLWTYRNILRDDGLSYGDYVEQLTFLLFLKMADEQSRIMAKAERLLARDGEAKIGGVGKSSTRESTPNNPC